MIFDNGHGPRAPARREKARTRMDILAELEMLKPKLTDAEWEVEEAEDELARAENLRDDLRDHIWILREELEPLLRPWERPRHKNEQKITAFVKVSA